MSNDKKNVNKAEYYLADIITGKPHKITIGRKVLYLYPVTLAKQIMLRWYVDALEINTDILKGSPEFEALRLVVNHRDVCCGMLAIHTSPNTYKDLYNMKARAERRNLFMKADDADLASIMLTVLSGDKADVVMQHLGIDMEQERLKKVMSVKEKNGKNSVTFGGKSVFGAFIGQMKEMGFTVNEILYECGYSFLQLVLADKLTSVYLSDSELDELPSLAVLAKTMDANDPHSADLILASLSGRGLKTK